MIKHSKKAVSEQARHLTDTEKCEACEHRYGSITGRYVIYRGDNTQYSCVKYLNVEEYLKAFV